MVFMNRLFLMTYIINIFISCFYDDGFRRFGAKTVFGLQR